MAKHVRHPRARGVLDIRFPAQFRDGGFVFDKPFDREYFSSPEYRAIVQNGLKRVGLTAVGTLIWLCLADGHTEGELTSYLSRAFPHVAPETIVSDCHEFLKQLTSLGFLELCE